MNYSQTKDEILLIGFISCRVGVVALLASYGFAHKVLDIILASGLCSIILLNFFMAEVLSWLEIISDCVKSFTFFHSVLILPTKKKKQLVRVNL